MEKYAIVEISGRQYKVSEGAQISTDLIHQDPGASVEFNTVFMVKDGQDYKFGAPNLKGAKVVATVEKHARKDKILVLKYLRKNHSKKLHGHRQDFSVLKIESIHV